MGGQMIRAHEVGGKKRQQVNRQRPRGFGGTDGVKVKVPRTQTRLQNTAIVRVFPGQVVGARGETKKSRGLEKTADQVARGAQLT